MSDDIVSRVGGAILLAETEWTPKAGVSKERAMALAAIEAMREPTEAMEFAGHEPLETSTGYVDGQLYWDAEGPYHVWQAMVDAVLKP